MKSDIAPIRVVKRQSSLSKVPHGAKLVKTACLVAFLTGICMIIMFFPVKQSLLKGAGWIKEQGALGYVCYIAVFIVEVCLGIPSTLFEAMSGFIFGFWESLIVTTIGKTCGCMLAFTLGGILGKDTLGEYLSRRFPTFKAMNKVFANADYKLLAMLQFAYLPIFIKCFGLSIMDVDPQKFFVTVLFCGFPYTVFWSYLGSTSQNLLKVLSGEEEAAPISTEQMVFVVLGIVSGIVAMIMLARYSKAQLKVIRENTRMTEELAAQAKEGSPKSNVIPEAPSPVNLDSITPEITVLSETPSI